MKKTKLTRSLLAACSIVALSVALSGCLHSDDDDDPATTPPPMGDGDGDGDGDDAMDDEEEDAMDDEEEEDMGPTPEEIAEATRAAGTKRKAIAAEAAQTTAAGLGGSDAPTTGAGSYTLDIEHGDVSITVEGATDAMDEEFMQTMDLGDGRTMHVRTHDADDDGDVVEEVAMVMTDIEADVPTLFDMVDGQMLNARDLDTNVDADGNGTLTDDYTALTIAAIAANASEADKMPLMNIMAPAFASGAPGTLQFPADTANDDNMDDATEVEGSYNGASGTYRCDATAGTNCTVGIDAMGAITAIGAGWIFIPDDGATSDVADAEYLSYGFWLQRTTDAMGVVTYDEVETFAMATGYAESAAYLGDVEGTASYSGSSVGVYVNNVLDGQGSIVSATSGHFLADVALDASFGGPGVATNNQHTISGTIDNFRLSGGEDNDWSVALGLADFSGRTAGNEPGMSAPGSTFDDADFAGTATGDAGAAAGSWNGVLHGSTADYDHDMDTSTAEINRQPSAVTGEFNANFTNGTAAGGFGATMDEE